MDTLRKSSLLIFLCGSPPTYCRSICWCATFTRKESIQQRPHTHAPEFPYVRHAQRRFTESVWMTRPFHRSHKTTASPAPPIYPCHFHSYTRGSYQNGCIAGWIVVPSMFVMPQPFIQVPACITLSSSPLPSPLLPPFFARGSCKS